jgi:glycosyltransferase involved in cell wall biosynthesis
LQKLKILFLIDIFDSRFEYDQVMLASKLAQKGYTVHVLTSSFLQGGVLVDNYYDKDPKGISVRRCPSTVLHVPGTLPLYVYRPPANLDTYDITHVFTLFTYSSFVAPFLIHKTKSASVMRAELGGPDGRTYRRTTRLPMYRYAIRWMGAWARAFTTYTSIERELLTSLGVQRRKIEVIPVGVNFEKFSEISASVGPELRLGFFGRLIPEKGVHRLVPLARRLQENGTKVKFVVAGLIERPEFVSRVLKELSGNCEVQYLGQLDKANNKDYYQSIDIALFPDLVPGTGAIAVLEAMSAGKLVISSNVYPFNEYVDHCRTGYLVSRERYVSEAAEIVRQLDSDTSLVEDIGTEARKRAREYDWNNVVQKYELLYNTILNGR